MANNKAEWYPMRVTYGREVKLKHYLDNLKIESFLPMKYKDKITPDGRKEHKLVPAINNLIFIRSNRNEMDMLKELLEAITPFRYIMDKEVHKPIVVPDKQMVDFIAVAGTCNEELIYLNNIEPLIAKGERVRITGGIFSGVEGCVVRIKKDRRVMVAINGLVAVATTFIHPSLLEKICAR